MEVLLKILMLIFYVYYLILQYIYLFDLKLKRWYIERFSNSQNE